jgi:hypothetical protein
MKTCRSARAVHMHGHSCHDCHLHTHTHPYTDVLIISPVCSWLLVLAEGIYIFKKWVQDLAVDMTKNPRS